MVLFKDKITVPYRKWNVDLNLEITKLKHLGGGNMNIKGKLIYKGNKCIFVWDQARFPVPLVLFRTRTTAAVGLAMHLAKNAVRCWEVNHSHRSNPGVGAALTPAATAYISKMINAGHIRRPHLKEYKGKTSLILIMGTVVNKGKLNPGELTSAMTAVDAVNQLANIYYSTHPHISKGTFNTWIRSRIKVEHSQLT